MIQSIVRDPTFLAKKSVLATKEDVSIAKDLYDTLQVHPDICVGMAANMIGQNKKIIVVRNGPFIMTMFNPSIVSKANPYMTEEGCLCHIGFRPVQRFQNIRVKYQDERMQYHETSFAGVVAETIQHECDHLEGILI